MTSIVYHLECAINFINSKGLFFRASDLAPFPHTKRNEIILSAMGVYAPNPNHTSIHRPFELPKGALILMRVKLTEWVEACHLFPKSSYCLHPGKRRISRPNQDIASKMESTGQMMLPSVMVHAIIPVDGTWYIVSRKSASPIRTWTGEARAAILSLLLPMLVQAHVRFS